jgi:diketogulonate reductase-like aldo/keto reductase
MVNKTTVKNTVKDKVKKAVSKTAAKVGTVMHEWKTKKLHSGSKKGPVVKNKSQAVAIALSEARKEGKVKKTGVTIPKKPKK